MITQERLKEILIYDEETGVFTWRVSVNRKIKPGTKAGHINNSDGYLVIGCDGTKYLVHRLAWLYVTGKHPANEIDHINRNRSDNRFSNLREATRKQNSENTSVSSSSTSGVRGVRRDNRQGKKPWSARIMSNGKDIYLGSFDHISDAHAAYLKAANDLFTHHVKTK